MLGRYVAWILTLGWVCNLERLAHLVSHQLDPPHRAAILPSRLILQLLQPVVLYPRPCRPIATRRGAGGGIAAIVSPIAV